MRPLLLGISPRQALGVVRDARRTAARRPQVVVDGVLAAELARSLSAGGAAGLVRVGGGPAGATVYVQVLAGAPTSEVLASLREAARRSIPLVAVQTAPGKAPVTYVLPEDVVACPPGQGFPVAEIGRVLARRLGQDGVGLAAELPALRAAVVRELVSSASLRAAGIGGLQGKRAHLPAMTLVQARLALDVAAAGGRSVEPQERAPELGAVVALAVGMRTLGRGARRLRLPAFLVGAITGYGATRVLGEVAVRRFAAPGTAGPSSDAGGPAG